jgi:putative OmpL-like beta-barrel porin-2
LNGYWHLANPNSLPSYVAHMSWRVSDQVRLTQNVYYGPDQRSTSLRFWRFFSNSMLELKDRDTTIALLYDLGTEQLLDHPDHRRTFWTGPALLARRTISGPWSVALRPELYWDQDGRQTGFPQFVQAITTTLEYKITEPYSTVLLRLEHRYDRSTGSEGGFFKSGEIAPGVIGLARDQHLLIFALMWNLDSR